MASEVFVHSIQSTGQPASHSSLPLPCLFRVTATVYWLHAAPPPPQIATSYLATCVKYLHRAFPCMSWSGLLLPNIVINTKEAPCVCPFPCPLFLVLRPSFLLLLPLFLFLYYSYSPFLPLDLFASLLCTSHPTSRHLVYLPSVAPPNSINTRLLFRFHCIAFPCKVGYLLICFIFLFYFLCFCLSHETSQPSKTSNITTSPQRFFSRNKTARQNDKTTKKVVLLLSLHVISSPKCLPISPLPSSALICSDLDLDLLSLRLHQLTATTLPAFSPLIYICVDAVTSRPPSSSYCLLPHRTLIRYLQSALILFPFFSFLSLDSNTLCCLHSFTRLFSLLLYSLSARQALSSASRRPPLGVLPLYIFYIIY